MLTENETTLTKDEIFICCIIVMNYHVASVEWDVTCVVCMLNLLRKKNELVSKVVTFCFVPEINTI
jgi:hypothetical protein